MVSDHREQIITLQRRAEQAGSRQEAVDLELAADLLEAHDETGISLDGWVAAREFVERLAGITIEENGA